MNVTQFRVLYRQFLFRMVDLELLSADAQGDTSKLFGQFAALLIFISIILSVVGMGLGRNRIVDWVVVHFMIATTMLVVGLFAVLSWDSTFPDRRDVLVLAPLPIRVRTVFLAKVAAVATALGMTIAMLHLPTGLVWPLGLNNDGGLFSFLRVLLAWWITMAAAGTFIFCCVLATQGIAAQFLPRRWFLRVSSALQMAAFALFVAAYFEEPKPVWSPAWWFDGLFEQLKGTPQPADMAWRAWVATGIAVSVTAIVYTLAYFRTMRRIVEEPDITPAARGGNWMPRFGDPFTTAISQFSLRTLLRSRQHRLMLAFYAGLGFAAAILFPQMPIMYDMSRGITGVSLSTTAVTIFIVILMTVGTRVVFSLPIDMRANWIFRITPYPEGPACMITRRRVLHIFSLVPVLAGSAAFLYQTWPRPEATKHLAALLLVGVITAELCLRGAQKLPFTCSYLPGKSNFNITFLLCSTGVFTVLTAAAKFERSLFDDAEGFLWMLAGLIALAVMTRWIMTRHAASPEGVLQFEETAEPAVFKLDLRRD